MKVYMRQVVIPRQVMFALDPINLYSAEIEESMREIADEAGADGYELDWWESLAITVRYDGLARGVLLTTRVNGETP